MMEDGSRRDYYDILGVPRNATKEEIKRAYRRLVLRYHPDRNRSPDAEARLREIKEAYEVLVNDRKRRLYDMYGFEGLSLGGGFFRWSRPAEQQQQTASGVGAEGISVRADGRRWLVDLLSKIPLIVVAVFIMSFLLFSLNHLSGGHGFSPELLARLLKAVVRFYHPSALSPQNVLALVVIGLVIAFLTSAHRSASWAGMLYVTGIGWYFTGSFVAGFFSAIARFGGGMPVFTMPAYGYGVGDLFLAGLAFLLGLAGGVARLIGRWVASQIAQIALVAAAVNLMAFLAMWLDKKQAEAEGYRLPEKAILRYAVLGGVVGVLAGAYVFRHKTQHKTLLAEAVLASAAAYTLLLGFI
jgi:uncharacterized membrane protein YsdA (DUF1294 family)